MMTRSEILDDLWRALPPGSRAPNRLEPLVDAVLGLGIDWTPAHSDRLATMLSGKRE